MKFAYRRSATDEQASEVDIVSLPERPGVYRVTVGEHVFELDDQLFHRAAFLKEAGDITLQLEGREYRLFDAKQRRRATATQVGDLHAPMAGKIIHILVQPGERIGNRVQRRNRDGGFVVVDLARDTIVRTVELPTLGRKLPAPTLQVRSWAVPFF